MISKRIRTIVTIVLTGVLAFATLTGCNNRNNSEATPTATVAPNGEATPSAAVSPTGETAPTGEAAPTDEAAPTTEATPTTAATPTTVATPTTAPSPTAEPTAVPTSGLTIPADLPSISSVDPIKEAIDKAILRAESGDPAYAYVQKTAYSAPSFDKNTARDNFNLLLHYFPKFKNSDPDDWDVVSFSEEICYMDKDFQPKKQIFTLADGSKVTLYTTKWGYSLDCPDRKREYLVTYNEDAEGHCIFTCDTAFQDVYTCYSYDARGNLVMSAHYRTEDGVVLLTEFKVYTYNDNNSLTSAYEGYPIGFPIPSSDNPDEPYFSRATYEYDDADNLITVKTEKTDSPLTVTRYTYHKDSDNRLTGWTVQNHPNMENGVTEWEYTVKYYANGSILVYSPDAYSYEGVYNAEIFVPSTELRRNLETTTHLRAYGDTIHTDYYLPVTQYFDDIYYYESYDYDSGSCLGLPAEPEDRTYLVFYGQMTEAWVKADFWRFNAKEYEGSDLVYFRNFQRNEDGHLTAYEHIEGSGLSAYYSYDGKKRLVRETYDNFDEHKVIEYKYDKEGFLTERVKHFTLSDTGSGEIDTTTTYRYTYNPDGTLNGMTAVTVANDRNAAHECKTVLTALPAAHSSVTGP